MTINFLDLGPCRFRVSDSTHDEVITTENSRFDSSAGETLKIEQLPDESILKPGRLILISVLSFLITAVRALIIPTQTLYHKRAPLAYSCRLYVKKEYSESAIYYIKSETEAKFMNMSKPGFEFGKEFELLEESFYEDKTLTEFNRRSQLTGINTSYIFLYVLTSLFALYGVIEINFTVLFICFLSAFTFAICHTVSLLRFKKALAIYHKDIDYSVAHYNEGGKKQSR